MVVMAMIMLVISMPMMVMGVGRTRTWLALLCRCLLNFLRRKMTTYVISDFDKSLGRKAIGFQFDDWHSAVGRFGKIRIKGDRAEERYLHHPREAYACIVTEQMYLVTAVAAGVDAHVLYQTENFGTQRK